MILRNERYRGVVHWNVSEWRKDPDTGKRQRIMRPREQWISHVEESLRIVSDALWERVQKRMDPAKGDVRLKSGGKAKYLLSGLLRCDVCGANYTIIDSRSYGCHSHNDGNACSNSIRIRKDDIENKLLRGTETGLARLLAPERVERMAKEMQRYYAERVRAIQTRATEAPKELQAALDPIVPSRSAANSRHSSRPRRPARKRSRCCRKRPRNFAGRSPSDSMAIRGPRSRRACSFAYGSEARFASSRCPMAV